MRWFVKVLRHYADFSGRARRQEYWMFVLFNMIFSFAWVILMTIVAVLFLKANDEKILLAALSANTGLSVVMMLPSLAVAVRRLHDIGKSGWMMLIALIPIAGGIWLLILLLTEGENKANEYGPNPKTSTETFSEHNRLKSAGIALIFATAVIILTEISSLILFMINNHWFFQINFIFNYIPLIIILIAGAFLLNEKKIYEIQGKRKTSIILLLIAAGIYFILPVLYVIFSKNAEFVFVWKYAVDFFVKALFNLSIVTFAVSLLLIPQNKQFIRVSSVIAIALSGLYLLWGVYFAMDIYTGKLSEILGMYGILLPASIIVLVCTFLFDIKDNSQTVSQGNEVFHDNNRATRIETTQAPPSATGLTGSVVFVREDREANKVWRIYKAPSKADAVAFLSRQPVNRPLYYVVVETREGNFGKDIEGFYQE